jgi:hypothetical protein
MSQMQSIKAKRAPSPIPSPIPIFAPRDSPEEFWFLISGKLSANIRSLTTWTETTGFEAVAVEATTALRELRSADTADGTESGCAKTLKHGVCPRMA